MNAVSQEGVKQCLVLMSLMLNQKCTAYASFLVISSLVNIAKERDLTAVFHFPIPVQWKRSPGKSGSHFDPNCDLFAPNERMEIITSTTCWFAMLTFLVALTAVVGPLWVFKLYFVPYWVYLPLPTITINFFVYTFLPQHVYCSYTQISCAHVPTTTYPSL